jgi:hypothetical protein
MPFGYSVWLFLKNNPAARWALGIAAGVMAFFTWLAVHDHNVRKRDRLKAVERTRKAADKTLKQMEKESNDTIESAREARAAVPDGIDSSSLRDDYADILFGHSDSDA